MDSESLLNDLRLILKGLYLEGKITKNQFHKIYNLAQAIYSLNLGEAVVAPSELNFLPVLRVPGAKK